MPNLASNDRVAPDAIGGRLDFDVRRALPIIRWVMIGAVAVALVPFYAPSATAEELTGKVVRVADGDTVTVLTSDKQEVRVRLAGIDAPEKKQPYSNRSKQNLFRLTHGKEVRADCHKTDRYGRKICKVWVQPQDCPRCEKTVEVGHAQIVAGLAWWYRKYGKEQSEEDRGLYIRAENEARSRQRGLWADAAPVPPWEYRQAGRSQ